VSSVDPDDPASFEHNKLSFSLINALWLARLAHVAYDDEKLVSQTLEDWGFVGRLSSVADTQFVSAVSSKFAVLAFRGTESNDPDDIIVDAQLQLKDKGWGDTAKVHGGFKKALIGEKDVIKNKVLTAVDALDSNKPLFICGHSLGGALAVLCADLLRAERPKIIIAAIYTYGQPRVGDDDFAKVIDKPYGGRHFRFVNNRDGVPRAPVGGGYSHSGRVAYFNDVGKLRMDPPLWYRALDTLQPTDDWKGIVKQTLADHAMSEYVRLIAATLKIGS
jgi:triacylglycerol lipase